MKVRVVGTGASVPPLVMTTERLLGHYPGPRRHPWTAEEFEKKTGIRERRFCVDLDKDTGRALRWPDGPAVAGPAVQLAEQALIEALERAGIESRELDALVVGGCTPDRPHFGSDAQLLHHRLGMRRDAVVLQTDVGCGGAPFCLQWASEMILSGVRRNVAVVLVQTISPLFDPEVYAGHLEYDNTANEAFLTTLLFGDGAGAVVLQAADDGGRSAILSSRLTNTHYEITARPAGGNLRPPGRPDIVPSDHAFYVVGRRVADAYPHRMHDIIDQVRNAAGLGGDDVARYFPHQSNLRLIEQLMLVADLPEDRTSINVDRYGNTSGASVLILLAEDVRGGIVELGSGAPIVIAAIGANLQVGAQAIAL